MALQPANRSEGQSVEVHVLREILACRIGIAANTDSRVADGDGADLSRGRQIGLQECRRTALRVRHVIETERGAVGRQQ